MEKDYNKTLNLPKTDFPMRGNLPEKEPKTLAQWESEKLYHKIMEKNINKVSYVLHDGPPYANGNIHMGHALNKILKDIIVKYKNMSGFKAPFVPGWDTHGLPTEIKARAKVGSEKAKTMSIKELRSLCAEFAVGYVETQKEQFKRLGVFGDWDDPYVTLFPEYEAEQVRTFAKMAERPGTIYRGLRPVYWCPKCETALAEAEIEYSNDECDSIYVKFKVANDGGKLSKFGVDLRKTYFLIWTTTAWTLPGNVAICVGPNFEYSVVKLGDEYYILASELVKRTMTEGKIEDYEIIGKIDGKELENMTAYHPFLAKYSKVIVGDHVTVESGTGCVHTAPGHGVEDFEACRNYSDLSVVVPVDSRGILTAEAGQFEGMHISKGGAKITEHLNDIGMLFAVKHIEHQYPHCWRCKSPVIFRATKQWFCSVESFKKDALAAVDSVSWNPSWGRDRMISMISERKDWCISRQRTWGVPIPIFFCKECGKEIIDKDIMMKIADIFENEGSGSWYEHDANYFLPENFECPHCGSTSFKQEKDIMDVWFDSGTSHAAVCAHRNTLKVPADLYLEGADQYRGWFQSSLLTSVAASGKAPYKNIVTHGWVVDESGRKQSKSLGNGVDPANIVKQYGADVLRLWVSSADYHSDVRMSQEILKQLSESYRKIRNTARFILGNLYGFDPNKDMVKHEDMAPIDRLALYKLNQVLDKCFSGYDRFEFYEVFHSIQKFCIVDMSNFYLDIIKDRLYVEKANSIKRRAAQTAMYIILGSLVRIIAPILSYTAEEIWNYFPKISSDNPESIFLNDMPQKVGITVSEEFVNHWNTVYKIRDGIKKILEIQRKEKVIGSSLEADIVVYCGDEMKKFINENISELKEVLIVSGLKTADEKGIGQYTVEGLEDFSIDISHSEFGKCERCWTYDETVGENQKHPTLCERCCGVIND